MKSDMLLIEMVCAACSKAIAVNQGQTALLRKIASTESGCSFPLRLDGGVCTNRQMSRNSSACSVAAERNSPLNDQVESANAATAGPNVHETEKHVRNVLR